jgi:hypothetical protein
VGAPVTAGKSLLDRIADPKKLGCGVLTAVCVLPAHWPMPTIGICRIRRTSPPRYAGAISLFNMLAGGERFMLYSRNKIEKTNRYIKRLVLP